MNELERFQKVTYQEEKRSFLSDKCPTCMGYLDVNEGKCKDVFCPVGIENK